MSAICRACFDFWSSILSDWIWVCWIWTTSCSLDWLVAKVCANSFSLFFIFVSKDSSSSNWRFFASALSSCYICSQSFWFSVMTSSAYTLDASAFFSNFFEINFSAASSSVNLSILPESSDFSSPYFYFSKSNVACSATIWDLIASLLRYSLCKDCLSYSLPSSISLSVFAKSRSFSVIVALSYDISWSFYEAS